MALIPAQSDPVLVVLVGDHPGRTREGDYAGGHPHRGGVPPILRVRQKGLRQHLVGEPPAAVASSVVFSVGNLGFGALLVREVGFFDDPIASGLEQSRREDLTL